ncbi:MAG: hypothetical protein HY554_04350 [Elusimicrobia bacterium]|nr:hypothetical protein [Elusimicrobiota bacterium]
MPPHRPLALNTALAAALLVAAGLVGLRFFGSEAKPGARASTSLGRPATAGRSQGAPAARLPAAGASGPSLWQTPEAEELSFGDFVEILGLEAERESVAPVARAFQRDFAADPALRETLARFAEAESLGEPRTARQFVATLEKRPEFQKLASKYASQQGSSAALSALLRSPELAAFARAVFSSGGRVPGSRGKPAVGARLQADPRKPGGRWVDAAAYVAAVHAAAEAAADRKALTADSAAPAGEVAGAGTSATPKSGPGKGGTGGDGHEVQTKLKDLQTGTSKAMALFREKFPWLANAFSTAELRMIEADIEAGVGLWGSCFKRGWFARCHRSCLADLGDPESGRDKCGDQREPFDKDPGKAGWNGCLEWKDNDKKLCISRCLYKFNGQPCTVPDKVWQEYCDPKMVCCRWNKYGSCTGNCCKSPHDPSPGALGHRLHPACVAAWDGMAPPITVVPTPTPAAPDCSPYFTTFESPWDIVDDGGGPKVVMVPERTCKCHYDSRNHFTSAEPANCNAKFTCASDGPQAWMAKECP